MSHTITTSIININLSDYAFSYKTQANSSETMIQVPNNALATCSPSYHENRPPPLARRSIRMPTSISVPALASTPIIHSCCRRVHFPVCHTVRFITIPPITPLPHVTFLLHHLLLRPDDVALRIVPLARRSRRGTVAFLVAELVRVFTADVDELGYGGADFNTHGF